MSLTSGELIKKINYFIKIEDDEGLVDLLEPLYKKGKLDDENTLLLGVVLMMPPFGDNEACINIFTSLYKGKFRYQAAIWHAYLYTTLYPVNDSFKIILEEYKDDAVACYMMARFLDKDKEKEALKWNDRSIQIKEFPNNLEFKLRWDHSLSKTEIKALFGKIEKLVINKDAKYNPKNKEQLYKEYWDNLILGTRVTSVVWEITKEDFEKRMKKAT